MSDRFALRRQLQAGILFDVYEAEDKASREVVRLSVVGSTWEEARALLPHVEAEAHRVKPLIHPHICPVRWVELAEGVLVVAEQAGELTLQSRLDREERLPPAEAVGIVMHVCEALAYAHEQGLVHGALTTESIRLEGDEVKLDGFGVLGAISRTPGASGLARRQRAAFISPEEARGNLPEPASDTYAIGVILFRLLTGRPPFDDDDPMALARAHCYTPAPRVRDLVPGVAEALDSLVTRTLAKDPASRPRSMKSLLGELREQFQRLAPVTRTPPEAALRPRIALERAPTPRVEVDEDKALAGKELTTAAALTVGRFLLGSVVIVAGALAATSLLFLWLVSTRQAEVIVPDVTGLAGPEAMARLGRLGLGMVVAEERYSPDGPAGSVIRMIAPYSGMKVRRGRQVRVVVSKGAENVRVPDVRYLGVTEAKAELKNAHLKAAEKVEEDHSYSVQRGQVVRHTPEPGEVVPQGTEVSLVRSTGPPPPKRVDSDTVTTYRVRVTVPAGEPTQRVRIEVRQSDGSTYTAHDELHLRGHVAEAEVRGVGGFSIRVYVNDELQREIRPVRE